jgi:hypothetical protein
MSGRDCIGIAKTGSGKTLAFVLPLLRHVKDQPPLAQGDGPIGLIMAPTRELVQQIAKVRGGRVEGEGGRALRSGLGRAHARCLGTSSRPDDCPRPRPPPRACRARPAPRRR